MPLRRRLILAAPMLPCAARAQDGWPMRGPIRFIVPGPAGGAGDVTARLVMERLAAHLGQQIVVENRPGAGTNIGMALVARAAADGYVLGLASIASHAVNRSLYRSLPFDPVADFAPVGLVALVPNMMVMPNGLPAAHLGEFIAHARARPGQINFGSVGAGSSQHLAGAQFAQATGIEMTHIPYNSAGQMNTDLMEGRIHVLFQSVSAVAELARAGRVRPLAVTGTERIPAFPDVPTLREGGVDIISTGWFGVVAPAQTPPAILERLHAGLATVLAEPDLARRLAAGGSLPRPSATRADFARFMAEETARWTPVVRATGATAD